MAATLEQLQSLRKKTHPDDIGTLPGRLNKKTNRTSPDMSYVTARYAMDTLDDGVGPENWATDKYRDHTGQLYVGVGILCQGNLNPEWVWKWDTGDESDIEPGKGEFSDAFKRACVHWGIARDLYPSPNKATAKKKPSTTAKTVAKTKQVIDDTASPSDITVPVDAAVPGEVEQTTTSEHLAEAQAAVVGRTGLTSKDKGKMFAALRDAGVPDDKRKELVHTITGKTSTTKMTNDDLDLVLAFTEGGQYSETVAE